MCNRGSSGPRARLEFVLIYSMSVSVDGFIADRDGAFDWHAPSDELLVVPPAPALPTCSNVGL